MKKFSLIDSKQTAIFGTSELGRKARNWVEKTLKLEVAFFLDSYRTEGQLDGLPIVHFSQAKNNVDFVVIASESHYEEMSTALLALDIPFTRWLPIKSYFFKSSEGLFAYKPVPKIANTSMKELIWCLNNTISGDEGNTDFHNQFIKDKSLFYTDEKEFDKIVFVRDPLERFISAFVHCMVKLQYFRGRFSDDINLFVDSFAYAYLQRFTHLHFCPQTEYLGINTTSYSKIYTLENLEPFNEYLTNKGISRQLEIRNVSESAQKKYFRNQLTDQNVERINQFYADDYKVFGDYFK
jgi:hypothetical protein